MFNITFSLFIIVALLHLYFCIIENEKYRRISKVFVILLLALAMIFKTSNYLLILALFLGNIGDIFLIFKEEKKWCFVVGALSFYLGHIVYFIIVSKVINN